MDNNTNIFQNIEKLLFFIQKATAAFLISYFVEENALIRGMSANIPPNNWIIPLLFAFQADDEFIIRFKVEQFYLPCGTQWLKVRDGSSLSGNLLADLSGAPDTTPSVVNSTGANLLLEFFSDKIAVGGQVCGGGFLAHATQISKSSTL